MKVRFIALIVGMLVMTAMPALASEGTAAEDHGGTYLALGDSVGAGTQQPLPFTPNGYTNKLFDLLQRDHGFSNFVNLACPGDDTIEMIAGIGGASDFGSLCYGPFAVLPPGGSSQLDVAVDYLTSHPGEVELITIVMGANDILACDPLDPDVEACLATQLGVIGANLPVILATLQAVAPGVPIVAMNYYNPNLAFWITGPEGQALAAQSLGLTTAFNGTLEAVYGAFGVPVADVESAFSTFVTAGDPPINVRRICAFTLMCERAEGGLVLSDYDPVTEGPQTDIHPSNLGYLKIANTHADLIEALGLLN